MQQQDVEQLVEQVALKLGRGLSLEDLDGVLLAYSSNQSHADRVRVNFLLSKRVPVDVRRGSCRTASRRRCVPSSCPANEELGMLGRVCVPLLVRGFRVGYLWVQQDIEDQSATAILTQLPGVRDELELLSGLLLESNTAESEFRRRREQEFLAACRGEANAVAAVAGWKEVQGRGPWQLVTVLDADGWAEGSDPIAVHADPPLSRAAGHHRRGRGAVQRGHGNPLRGPVQGVRWPGGPRPGAGPLPAGAGQALRAAGAPDHPGHSEGFAKPRELADAYRQSQQAAQAAAVDPQLGELVDCRATGVYQLLASAGGGAGAWADAGSVYFRMLEDHDRNGELLPVLELLYDNDGSVQDVATKLHLHRSSIYNRLGRIRQLLGVDPLKGMVRLELHAALKARRWAGRPRI